MTFRPLSARQDFTEAIDRFSRCTVDDRAAGLLLEEIDEHRIFFRAAFDAAGFVQKTRPIEACHHNARLTQAKLRDDVGSNVFRGGGGQSDRRRIA